jgi:hypothetical protein
VRDAALRLVSRAGRAVASREAVLVAALLLFGGLWTFGVLAEDLLTGDPLVQVDQRAPAGFTTGRPRASRPPSRQ